MYVLSACTMLLGRKFLQTTAQLLTREHHVAVIGCSGEIGQTLSLLLRAQPYVTKLTVHDVQEQTPGVVLDLSHVPAESALQGYCGEETLERAIRNADLIIATGGTIRKPGMSKKNFFTANTEFIKNLAIRVSKVSPLPHLAILTEPINTLVPMAAEVLRSHGEYDPKKLFGITTVDTLTAQSLYALENNLNPRECNLPVIGGHSEKTMVPLLSQMTPQCHSEDKYKQEFSNKVRKSAETITSAKKGLSPTISVAYGALIFARSMMDAMEGRPAKVHAFVENNDFGCGFFSGLVSVDPSGAGEMQRFMGMSNFEYHLLESSIEQIRKDVLKGKKYLELA